MPNVMKRGKFMYRWVTFLLFMLRRKLWLIKFPKKKKGFSQEPINTDRKINNKIM